MKLKTYIYSVPISITIFFFIIHLIEHNYGIKNKDKICNFKFTNLDEKKACNKIKQYRKMKRVKLFFIYLSISIGLNLINLVVKKNLLH